MVVPLLPAKLIVIIFPRTFTFNYNNSKLSQYKSAIRPPRPNNTITAVHNFAGTPAISLQFELQSSGLAYLYILCVNYQLDVEFLIRHLYEFFAHNQIYQPRYDRASAMG
jgi:hypothetical protein